MAGSDPLAMATDVAPTGGREAIAGLLMRERQWEYTQLKSFRCVIFTEDDDKIAHRLFQSTFWRIFVNEINFTNDQICLNFECSQLHT